MRKMPARTRATAPSQTSQREVELLLDAGLLGLGLWRKSLRCRHGFDWWFLRNRWRLRCGFGRLGGSVPYRRLWWRFGGLDRWRYDRRATFKSSQPLVERDNAALQFAGPAHGDERQNKRRKKHAYSGDPKDGEKEVFHRNQDSKGLPLGRLGGNFLYESEVLHVDDAGNRLDGAFDLRRHGEFAAKRDFDLPALSVADERTGALPPLVRRWAIESIGFASRTKMVSPAVIWPPPFQGPQRSAAAAALPRHRHRPRPARSPPCPARADRGTAQAYRKSRSPRTGRSDRRSRQRRICCRISSGAPGDG